MKKRYVHISIDNVIENFIDITKNKDVYKSVFENLFFKDLKHLNDTYGAVFTINCINSAENFDISKITDAYKWEFQKNSHWLKFAFHSENLYSKYNDDVLDIAEQYKKFSDAIINMAGEESIDTVIRLSYYTGNKNNIMALKGCDFGIQGFLTADDDREVNYYLTDVQNKILSKQNFWYDDETSLYAIPTQTRLEKINDVHSEFERISNITSNGALIIEFFTHERAYNREKLFEYVKTAYEQNYIFDFAMNHLNEL